VKKHDSNVTGILEASAMLLQTKMNTRIRALKNNDVIPIDVLNEAEKIIRGKYGNRNYSLRKELQILYYHCHNSNEFREEIKKIVANADSLPKFLQQIKIVLDKSANI